jgi:hypothetical protein
LSVYLTADSVLHRATCGRDGEPCPTGEHGFCPGCRSEREVPIRATADKHDDGCPMLGLGLELPVALDDRQPFPVTHPYFDAPDAAVLDLGGDPVHPERTGLYQRQGDTWYPVATA